MNKTIFSVGVAVLFLAFSLSHTLAASTFAISYNNEDVYLKNKLIVKSERVLLPLREISEAFGYAVNWNKENKRIDINNGKKRVILYVNEKTAEVNNQLIGLDVPAQVINGVTYVPLRFLSEAFGQVVNWNQNLHKVEIIDAEFKDQEKYFVNLDTKKLMKTQVDKNRSIAAVQISHKGTIDIKQQLTKNGNQIIIVDNNYGEPSIFYDRTIVYLKDDQVIETISAKYMNVITEKIEIVGQTVGLSDGRYIYLFDDVTTELVGTYDLNKIIGEGNYLLEVVGDGYFLVREQKKGVLTLVHLDSLKVTELYDVLLPDDEKHYALYGREPMNYDNIVFVKQEANNLYFKYSGLNVKDAQYEYIIEK